jgi:hypothetical protein
MDFSSYPRRKHLERACSADDLTAEIEEHFLKIQGPHDIPAELFDAIVKRSLELTPALPMPLGVRSGHS